MWSLFERVEFLRPESPKGLKLDNRIQNLVWLLGYLCQTIEGVPLNDLATYVTQNLQEKSEQQFREELIILGKANAEIDIWFRFAKFSLKHQNRKLNSKTIHLSIQKAQPLVSQYKILAEELGRIPDKEFMRRAENLTRAIEQLESSDSYLAQAIHETSQVPHWDIDESAGGS